jgi:BlaI family transcriptional regulator, penicillinase repressor
MGKLSLTSCEAEVMNVVWAQNVVTVQDVVDAIPRQLAYTTVMTTIKILEDKGFVERGEKRGRAYVYRPLVSCESASRSTVSEMANRFFDGSVKSMVLSLIKTKQITPEDLAELRTAIDSLENAK